MDCTRVPRQRWRRAIRRHEKARREALDRLTDNGLTDILKRWGFTKKKLKDCNGWEAPELDKLREQIKRKYPAVEWTADAVKWGQTPQDTEE